MSTKDGDALSAAHPNVETISTIKPENTSSINCVLEHATHEPTIPQSVSPIKEHVLFRTKEEDGERADSPTEPFPAFDTATARSGLHMLSRSRHRLETRNIPQTIQPESSRGVPTATEVRSAIRRALARLEEAEEAESEEFNGNPMVDYLSPEDADGDEVVSDEAGLALTDGLVEARHISYECPKSSD